MEKLSKLNGIFVPLDSSQSLFWIALRKIYLQMEILSQVSTGPQNPNKTMKQHRLSFLFWLHHWNHCLVKRFCLKKLPSVFFYSAVCLHSCSFVCVISWNQIQWCRSPSSYKNWKWAILTEKIFLHCNLHGNCCAESKRADAKSWMCFSFILFCRFVREVYFLVDFK